MAHMNNINKVVEMSLKPVVKGKGKFGKDGGKKGFGKKGKDGANGAEGEGGKQGQGVGQGGEGGKHPELDKALDKAGGREGEDDVFKDDEWGDGDEKWDAGGEGGWDPWGGDWKKNDGGWGDDAWNKVESGGGWSGEKDSWSGGG